MNDAFPRGLGGGGVRFGVVAALMLAVAVPALAFAHGSSRIIGRPKAGKALFVSTCGVCHTLKAAGTVGSVGPNLDKVAPLTEPVIIKAITNGGATVMAKAAAAKYTTQMVPYKGALTTEQINNIAAYLYVSTHKPS
jgi:mono/diheme cytochrome c family protein